MGEEGDDLIATEDNCYMNDESKKSVIARIGRWKWSSMVVGVLICSVVYAYVGQIFGDGPNGSWSKADLNGDGVVTREEMKLFGTMKPHRNTVGLLS